MNLPTRQAVAAPPDRVTLSLDGDHAVLTLGGEWKLADGVPDPVPTLAPLSAKADSIRHLTIAAGRLGAWDDSVLAFLLPVLNECRLRAVEVDYQGLPHGLVRLIDLVEATPDQSAAIVGFVGVDVLDALVERFRKRIDGLKRGISFVGEVLIAAGVSIRRGAEFPMRDLWNEIELCGAQALGIVAVIAFLVGLIMAFVGGVQLRQFGAGVYIADLVGLAVAREMAPVMTAIVLAGRTGAAFAAELGAMVGNEEVDALDVLGLSGLRYLVLPRVLALILMMPLLTLYADLIGVFGGYTVGNAMFGLSLPAFFHELNRIAPLRQIGVGVAKSVVFGIIVALSGCYRGLKAERSAAGVGAATTDAVVTAILIVIIADGLFAILLQGLGL